METMNLVSSSIASLGVFMRLPQHLCYLCRFEAANELILNFSRLYQYDNCLRDFIIMKYTSLKEVSLYLNDFRVPV